MKIWLRVREGGWGGRGSRVNHTSKQNSVLKKISMARGRGYGRDTVVIILS